MWSSSITIWKSCSYCPSPCSKSHRSATQRTRPSHVSTWHNQSNWTTFSLWACPMSLRPVSSGSAYSIDLPLYKTSLIQSHVRVVHAHISTASGTSVKSVVSINCVKIAFGVVASAIRINSIIKWKSTRVTSRLPNSCPTRCVSPCFASRTNSNRCNCPFSSPNNNNNNNITHLNHPSTNRSMSNWTVWSIRAITICPYATPQTSRLWTPTSISIKSPCRPMTFLAPCHHTRLKWQAARNKSLRPPFSMPKMECMCKIRTPITKPSSKIQFDLPIGPLIVLFLIKFVLKSHSTELNKMQPFTNTQSLSFSHGKKPNQSYSNTLSMTRSKQNNTNNEVNKKDTNK